MGQEYHLQLHCIEQLRRLLLDPSERVRKEAARGLAALHADGASQDLEALKATLPHQDHFMLDRLKREAVCPRSNPDADAKKQVECLTTYVQNLEDKLNKVLSKIDGSLPLSASSP